MSRRPPGVLYRTDLDPPAAVPPTPAVAERAAQLGLDLGGVRGHGVGGRIRLVDLPVADRPAAVPPVDAASPTGTATGTATATGTGTATGTRTVAVAEADVTGLLAGPAAPGELLARVAAAVLLASEGTGLPAGLSVTVPDATGALAAVSVPDATELSVPGLIRAVERVRGETAGGATGGAGLTVHDTGADGLLLELPAVDPVPALLVAVGAPRRQVVPDTSGGGLVLSVRWFVHLVAVSDPARVRRGPAAALLRAAVAAVEDTRGDRAQGGTSNT